MTTGEAVGRYDSSGALQGPPNMYFDSGLHPLFGELNQALDYHRSLYAYYNGPPLGFDENIGGVSLDLCEHLVVYARRFCEQGLEEHGLTVLDEGIRWGGPQVHGNRYRDLAVSAVSHGKVDLAFSIALDEARIRSGGNAPRTIKDIPRDELRPYGLASFAQVWLTRTSSIYRAVRERQNTSGLEQLYTEKVQQHLGLLASTREAGRLPDLRRFASDTHWVVDGLNQACLEFTVAGAPPDWIQQIRALDERIAVFRV